MWLPPVLVFPPNRSRLEYTPTTNCWTRYCWSFQTSHLHCLKLNTGYSTVFYSVGSSNPTQRSWTMILTCTCTCTRTTVPSRCLYQAAALVIWCSSLSRYHSAASYHHSCSEVFILLKLWALSQRRRRPRKAMTLKLLLTSVVIAHYNHRTIRSKSRRFTSVLIAVWLIECETEMARYRDKTSEEFATESMEADCGAWITYIVSGKDKHQQQLPFDAWLQHNLPSMRTR